MVKRATIADLAEAAGVSVATVDRVLNRRLPVRTDTAEQVAKAAEKIGFHAAGLLKKRLTETPIRRFGFLLQKRHDAFYQTLGHDLQKATTSAMDISGKALIDFSEELVPATIVTKLQDLATKCHAVAVVAVDHPTVKEAISSIASRGKPVFTLLSDVSTPGRTANIALDSRKLGRTAGWLVARNCQTKGKVGVIVGSHRYINQEISEISFLSYVREHAPHLELLESIVCLDDAQLAYEAASDLLDRHQDLVAIYDCGGGQDGLINAMREKRGNRKVVGICNEVTESTRLALIDGTVDMLLATPTERIARELVKQMTLAVDGIRDIPGETLFPAEIYISENI
jgi:LacI family transcriptional regulator